MELFGGLHSIDSLNGRKHPVGALIIEAWETEDSHRIFYMGMRRNESDKEYDLMIDGTQIGALYSMDYEVAVFLQDHLESGGGEIYICETAMEELEDSIDWDAVVEALEEEEEDDEEE